VSSEAAADALLTELRHAYEDFYARSGEEVYRFRAGLKESLDLEPILRDYPLLSSAATLDRIRSLEANPEVSGTRRELLDRFERICLDRRLDEETAGQIVGLEEAQAREAETVDGQRQSFFGAQLVAAATGEREKRNRLALAHAAMCERLLPSLVDKWKAQERAANALGFDSYLEAVEHLRGVDVRAMIHELREVLEPRTARFCDELRGWLGRTGIRSVDGGIEIHDLWHLWQADVGGGAFEPDRILPSLEGTLAGLGLDLSEGGRVVLDLDSRPGKNPRAFCAPVVIPARVYLVIQPAGGARDYLQLFHESGHALHFALTDPRLPMEQRDATGYALTESFAFLFEHLIHDPVWLDELGMRGDRQAHVRLTNLRNEYIVRRLTAEMEALVATEGRPAERPAEVGRRFEELCGFPVDPAAAAFYIDDGLYAAEYARGFAFVARLREHLRSEYGRRFWASRRAGGFLRELWSTGNRYDTESMSRELWKDSLGYEAFVAELTAIPAA